APTSSSTAASTPGSALSSAPSAGRASCGGRRVHSGERPYACTDCGHSFGQSARLSQHRRTHNGDRPHRCTDCGR
ncbi:ZSC20 protein, partial [Agelaius phoeniceus]|nr:ZSC20 protein [Agelaius phoeniceus]